MKTKLGQFAGNIVRLLVRKLNPDPFAYDFGQSKETRNISRPPHLAVLLALALLGTADCALAQRPLGCDVSDYQGTNVNWTTAKNNGIVFAWTKATEGAAGQYVSQASFTINETKGKAAGIYMGAYHFCHPSRNAPSAEVSYFWSVAGPYILADGKTLTPMLDFETFTGMTGASSYADWANQWCSAIQNNASNNGALIKPLVYISACNASELNSSVAQWLSDIADYNGQSAQSGSPWSTSACMPVQQWGTGVWSFWQYTDADPVGGEAGDGDVYNGSLTSLVSTSVAVSIAPTITSLSTNITIWQGSNATFSVTASNALTYQWTLNHTNIPNATATSYAINNARLSNAGAYNVVVSNAHAGTTSPTVFLSVLGPLTNAPGAIVAPSNMVDWWPADGNANDIYGTANGTPFGGFYYSPGHSGEAFHFDGSSGYVSTGAASITPPWTASMWVNYSHTSQPAASLLEDGSFALRLEQKGSGTHNVGISQNNYTDSVFSYAAPTGTWVHLAFVGTTSNVTLYANGVNEGSINTNNMPLPRAYIGAGYAVSSATNDYYMLGNLDDVMIFGRALGSNEIDSIYNAGSASLVRAPYILGGVATTNGHFNLNLEGMTGKNYTLYVTTNMLATNVSSWINLGLLANPNGTNTYVVPNINKYQQIYFRVSQPY